MGEFLNMVLENVEEEAFVTFLKGQEVGYFLNVVGHVSNIENDTFSLNFLAKYSWRE
jgi:hypothetical protein